jgi:hypothetical protein
MYVRVYVCMHGNYACAIYGCIEQATCVCVCVCMYVYRVPVYLAYIIGELIFVGRIA